jgi:hypothetical protein
LRKCAGGLAAIALDAVNLRERGQGIGVEIQEVGLACQADGILRDT